MENSCPLDQEVSVAGPSKPKSPRIEGSFLESLRASPKEEITSEIKNLLVESQREMLRLLKPETRENVRENTEEETENETRSFYTPTKSVRTNSTQNNDTNISRNTRFQLFSARKMRFSSLIVCGFWHCAIFYNFCKTSPQCLKTCNANRHRVRGFKQEPYSNLL